MGNKFGNAYGLTVLIPIKHGTEDKRSYDKIIRDRLQQWPLGEKSPLAKVPNTYLSRVFLLNDVFYEGAPAIEEHLKNKYLVFSSNFFGERDDYLRGMWNAIGDLLKDFLQHCVAFNTVNSSADFIHYIKRCQIKTSLFFNGSTDKPLDEQLKALYVKQSFIHFAYLSDHFRYEEGKGAIKLQQAFKRFVKLIDIDNLKEPSWPVAAQKVPADIELSVKAIIDDSSGAVK
ncbi:MAG: hypothetical protein ACJAUL_000287 [Paraglaciecola sp.]|jgi:hypothetical protein